ncbi:MAG: hypothetical protein ED559_06015 [Phycisphaera sp.]|nr:MAG: hypothetical protein ED559_06015 [Phycisphaera sp.]
MKAKLVALAGLFVFAMLAVGCSPVTVNGKIIAGNLSVITAVPATDSRLEGEGVEGATITAVQEARSTVTLTSVSDKEGVFDIPLKGDSALGQAMSFQVEAEGYLPARVTMPTPTPHESLLVVLKPIRSSSE